MRFTVFLTVTAGLVRPLNMEYLSACFRCIANRIALIIRTIHVLEIEIVNLSQGCTCRAYFSKLTYGVLICEIHASDRTGYLGTHQTSYFGQDLLSFMFFEIII